MLTYMNKLASPFVELKAGGVFDCSAVGIGYMRRPAKTAGSFYCHRFSLYSRKLFLFLYKTYRIRLNLIKIRQ